MQLPNTLIEKAMSYDEGALHKLNKIRYNADTERVEAGDGFICAMVPIPEDNPYGTFFLSADAIDYIRAKDTNFVIKDGKALVAGAVFEPPKNQKFPNDLALVIPDNDDMEFVATINVDLLYRLAQAICPTRPVGFSEPRQNLCVNLFASKQDSRKSPIVVSCANREHNIGVLMPLRNKEATPSYTKPTKS